MQIFGTIGFDTKILKKRPLTIDLYLNLPWRSRESTILLKGPKRPQKRQLLSPRNFLEIHHATSQDDGGCKDSLERSLNKGHVAGLLL